MQQVSEDLDAKKAYPKVGPLATLVFQGRSFLVP